MPISVEEAKQLLAILTEGDSLTQLPELAKRLQELPAIVEALQAEADLKAGFKTYREETDSRLKAVQDSLENQQNTLFIFQEDYKLLLGQIRGVLVKLEDYLRRHT